LSTPGRLSTLTLVAVTALKTAPLRPPPPGRARRARFTLADGARTTVHVAAYDTGRTELRVAVLRGQAKLEPWCAARGVQEALVGGFFERPGGLPLGEIRTRGVARAHVPFAAPWDALRACVHVEGGEARIAPRHQVAPVPRGDLLQAGPLLVQGGVPVFDRARDTEGFSAGAAQFDSDITAARHPRAALGIGAGRFYAVCCDGRSRHDAGLTLEELAALMAGLGCESALNLDGGGSSSLVSGGVLRNTPRRDVDTPEPGGRPISTALLFVPRS
jgi:phosphodiester glycosidase